MSSAMTMPSSALSLGNLSSFAYTPPSNTTSSSSSLVENLIGKAEALAGHPGHALLQGKPRQKASIYHPAAHMMTGQMSGGGMGLGLSMGMNAIPSSLSLPYPKDFSQMGKKGR